MSENGFHASASPWEALLERMNWLKRRLEDDSFGQELINNGISKEMINILKDENPSLVTDEGKEVSMIDYLEDMSATECITAIQRHLNIETSQSQEQ
jgi:hypothetical protein